MILTSQVVLLVIQLLVLYVAFFGGHKPNKRFELLIPKVYVLLSALQVGAYISFGYGTVNTVMMYVFSIFETIFLARYIAKGTFKRLTTSALISLILVMMYLVSMFRETSVFRYELCVILEQLYIVSLCFSYVFLIVGNENKFDVTRNEKFWIVAGALIFNGSTLPLFVMEYFDRNLELSKFHMVTCLFFLISCLLFIKAFNASKCNTTTQPI